MVEKEVAIIWVSMTVLWGYNFLYVKKRKLLEYFVFLSISEPASFCFWGDWGV